MRRDPHAAASGDLDGNGARDLVVGPTIGTNGTGVGSVLLGGNSGTFGAVANEHVASLKDLNGREFLVLSALAAAVLLMGVYPLPFTEVMHASVNDLLRHVALPKL